MADPVGFWFPSSRAELGWTFLGLPLGTGRSSERRNLCQTQLLLMAEQIE